MNVFIYLLYVICVVIILSMPSVAISMQMIWDDYFACESYKDNKKVPNLLIKYLIHQTTIITILMTLLCANMYDPEITGGVACIMNFVNCMLYWSMCNRCIKNKKCIHSRTWIITLGFINLLLPVLYYTQKHTITTKKIVSINTINKD